MRSLKPGQQVRRRGRQPSIVLRRLRCLQCLRWRIHKLIQLEGPMSLPFIPSFQRFPHDGPLAKRCVEHELLEGMRILIEHAFVLRHTQSSRNGKRATIRNFAI